MEKHKQSRTYERKVRKSIFSHFYGPKQTDFMKRMARAGGRCGWVGGWVQYYMPFRVFYLPLRPLAFSN